MVYVYFIQHMVEVCIYVFIVYEIAEADVAQQKKLAEEDMKAKAKPRTIWDKPEVSQIKDTSLVLTWKSSSIPSYAVQTEITYTIEQRQPYNMEWNIIATDIKETTYRVSKGFVRSKDYYFRIRACNEFGTSEPSMPAMVRKFECKCVIQYSSVFPSLGVM